MFTNMVMYGAGDDQPAVGLHMHLQSCAICQKKSIMKDGRRQHLRMCPCAEAFYCGTEHQNDHWNTHKKTCYDRLRRKRKTGPPTAIESAVKYILQVHDSAMVDIGTLAILRDDPFVGLKSALEDRAVLVKVQQTRRTEWESMEVAQAAGRIPPFELSTKKEDTVVAPLGDLCRALKLGRNTFENPVDLQSRRARGDFCISVLFMPLARPVSFYAPKMQAGAWELKQRAEKSRANPPYLYLSIHAFNNAICYELTQEKEKTEKSATSGESGSSGKKGKSKKKKGRKAK